MKTDLFRLLVVAVAIVSVGSLGNWAAAQEASATQQRTLREHESVREEIASTTDDAWYRLSYANDFASQAGHSTAGPVTPEAVIASGAALPLRDDIENQVAEGDFLSRRHGLFTPGRGRFFGGAEVLAIRPHFSEATAYIRRSTAVTGPNNTLVSSDEWVYFDYDYEVSTRAYFGYRLDDRGAEIRFTYWSLRGSDSQSATTNAAGTVIPTYFDVQPGANDTLTATSSVRGNVYDLDFSRSIQLGDERQTCGSRARWDLRWSAGVRVADMGYNTQVGTNDPTDGRLDTIMDYIGAGPRVGLEGRRYFGASGQFSIYSTLDIALLLGQFDHSMTRTTPPVGVGPTVIESFINNTTRMVPVAEIELGTSWSPTDRLTFSAGWFFQSWWDLGMGEQQASNLLGGGARYSNDDSNIMAWDGITLRVEYQF